jgi:hypothetical protein
MWPLRAHLAFDDYIKHTLLFRVSQVGRELRRLVGIRQRNTVAWPSPCVHPP